ncbi:MAG: alpha/beta hydrolase [Bauldia sp.]|nr:alpha/beta hydrolase [Bauldia sp.]
MEGAAAPDDVRFVTSRDGTRIGYRRSGRGPALVLLHGAMQSGINFRRLAEHLADRFTVIVPDRRGRGLSGPFRDGHGIRAEVDDLDAVIADTGAADVFGLSSGALVVLEAALGVPTIRRVALYEPPLRIAGRQSSIQFAPRYEREMAAGDLAAAFVTVLKGTGDRTILTRLPRFLLVPLLRMEMRREHPRPDGAPLLRDLLPTVRFDVGLVEEVSGRLPDYAAISAETLLVGGSKSAPFLAAALDALAGVIPRNRRLELRGIGHIGPDNSGRPGRVAAELRRWFG